MTSNSHRAAFLAGIATLTAQQVWDWAKELDPAVYAPVEANFPPEEPLMVSVLPPDSDRRGLSGATVIRGPFGSAAS